jgi:hypothetical protein
MIVNSIIYVQGATGDASSSWTYFLSAGDGLQIDLPSIYSTSFFDIKVNWRCVSELPIDEKWHVSCSQRKVEVNGWNKVGCVGCDCCGSNLYWDSGKCKPCASPQERFIAFMAVVVVASLAVIGVIVLMQKYEMSLITKHLAPLAVFMNFYKSSFSNFSMGDQWDSNVQRTAAWMDSLMFVQPEGALFNPKCVNKSISFFQMKAVLLSVAPLVLALILYLMYKFKVSRNRVTNVTEPGVEEASTDPVPFSGNEMSNKVGVSNKSSTGSNNVQVGCMYVCSSYKNHPLTYRCVIYLEIYPNCSS